MDNAELYNKSNILQKRDAQQCLEEYAKDMKWKNYSFNVIDIGSGDGGVTSILKTYIPNNCKKLLGCDINENMVKFANARYAKNSISFKVLNIESDLPDQLREKFDHAFSFYALHWIKCQEFAFSNIYDLLTRGGNCLLLFLGHMSVFDMWRKLVRYPRWSYWMKDIDRYISPYHDCQDPEENIKLMMTNIGFTNVKVKCVHKSFVYTGKDAFKNNMSAVNPFKIPLEMQEDYLEDHVKAVRDMELVIPSNCGDGSFNVKMNYKLIIVYAEK